MLTHHTCCGAAGCYTCYRFGAVWGKLVFSTSISNTTVVLRKRHVQTLLLLELFVIIFSKE